MTDAFTKRRSPIRLLAWPGVTTLLAFAFWQCVNGLDQQAEQHRKNEALRRQVDQPLFTHPDEVIATLRDAVRRRALEREGNESKDVQQ